MIKSAFAALLAALVLPGAALAAVDPTAAAFVVLSDDGAPQARVITTAGACPSITVDGKELPMSVRSPAGTAPLRTTRSAPADSKPSAFPVLSCEAAIPAGAVKASVGRHPLPLPAASPKRIVVFGDTGCRIKAADKAFQGCNDLDQYPFARLAAAAAAWGPDLVVHVGDYEYRENPCPAAMASCAGSPWGYGWDAWNADFFAPGQRLLAAAPWVMVRGNHESCNRAGQGWWRFLDPRPLMTDHNCDNPAWDSEADFASPYAVPLGDGAQLVVLDSSNTSGAAIPPDSGAARKYRDDYARLDALSQRAPYTIVASHHPLLGFAATEKNGEIKLNPGNLGLQSVFGSQNPWLFPSSVQMALAGHVHVWEQISFSSPHPTQFVAGFGGTQEDIVPLPRELPADASVAPGAVVEAFSSWVDGFGFMTLTRTGATTWDVEVHDWNGSVVNRCQVTGRHSKCETPQVVWP